MVGVLGALIAIGYYFYSRPAPQLQESDLGSIQQALSQVPAQDIAAPELGLPRPPGSTRSYFHQNGKVITTIYASHSGFEEIRSRLQEQLPASGWQSLGRSGTAPVQAAQSWSGVFGQTGKILQVSVISTSGATSTIYILENSS